MHIELEKDINGEVTAISGYGSILSADYLDMVISLKKRNGVWKVSNSICLPVNIEKAKEVCEIFSVVMLKLHEVTHGSSNNTLCVDIRNGE